MNDNCLWVLKKKKNNRHELYTWRKSVMFKKLPLREPKYINCAMKTKKVRLQWTQVKLQLGSTTPNGWLMKIKLLFQYWYFGNVIVTCSGYRTQYNVPYFCYNFLLIKFQSFLEIMWSKKTAFLFPIVRIPVVVFCCCLVAKSCLTLERPRGLLCPGISQARK